ncbi:MAG: hydantoinase/carbamoylase family amidase [Rhodobacteraceae bacterium]|nr:hydantoinase/carbamoylase family amidase [Paracoccaceae bacterium]
MNAGAGAEALGADFEAVGAIGRAAAGGGWSRPGYGAEECRAIDWLGGRARAAGLEVRLDGAGNLIARLDGQGGPAGPAVTMGSHLDTVANGGAFDGVVGVLCALDVLRRQAGARAAGAPALPLALELVCFRDEEGRFGALTGSRAMTGALAPDAALHRRDADGVTLAEAMAGAGLDPGRLGAARRPAGAIAAFLEVHIEQGRILEDAGIPLGLVTAIAGQRRISVRFEGAADHAGAAPMAARRDAFAAAARFADRFREMVIARGGGRARGTIGIVEVAPNLGNVIPAEVRLGLELRDEDEDRLADLARATAALAAEAAAALGAAATVRPRHATPPVAMAAAPRAALAAAARAEGLATMPLLSGAPPDAGILGAVVPAAMLFVPSRGGRSHCPEEWSDRPGIEGAARVLGRAAAALAGGGDG